MWYPGTGALPILLGAVFLFQWMSSIFGRLWYLMSFFLSGCAFSFLCSSPSLPWHLWNVHDTRKCGMSLSLSLLGFHSRMYNSLSILYINPMILLDEPSALTPRTSRVMVNIGGRFDTMQAHIGDKLLSMSKREFLDYVNSSGKTHPKCVSALPLYNSSSRS